MSEQIQDSAIQERSDVAERFGRDKLIHDLRNCLSPMLMQAQLLLRYADRGDAALIKKSAEAIERSIKEMAALLAQKQG